MNCGTNSGYNSHVRKGEKTCDACRHAHARYQSGFRVAVRAFTSDQYNPQTFYRERPQDTEWMQQGRCRGKPQDWWFPEKGADPSLQRTAQAICAECPVREPCLDYALASDERFGVWGGLTVKERRREKRRRERLAS